MLGRYQAVLNRCLYCVACASALVLASEPAEAQRCPVINGWTPCNPAEQERARAAEQAELERESKTITDQGLNEPPESRISSAPPRQTPSASPPERVEPSASGDYRPPEQQFVQDSEVTASRGIPVGDPAAQRAQGHELDDAVSAFFWRWVKIIGGVSIAIWLFKRRQAIAEWYYSLQPHPASHQVDDAIDLGLPIDGELFAAVNQPFEGNRYEIAVRNQQADDLTGRLRRHEAALRTNSEAILRMKREELRREQEFMKAHEALINAGVDHEMAAAHLEALRKATGQ